MLHRNALDALRGAAAARAGHRRCRPAAAAVLALALGGLGAACGATPAVPQAPSDAAIEGPTWRLVQRGAPDASAPRAAEPAVTARFSGGQVEGFSGCNRFGGGYRLESGRLVISGELRTTMRACVGDAMATEDAFLRAFSGTLAYAIEGGTLTLTPAAGDALVFRAGAAPALDGVRWRVTGYNNGRQAVVSPIAGTALTLAFSEGGLQGQAGCNGFHAKVELAGGRIAIGPPAATRKACASEALRAQERDFLAALETAATWSVGDGRLELRTASGERVLTARPAAE